MEEKIMVTGVKGMYCRQCPELILGDMLQTRGVLDASVAYFKGVLTVKFDPGIVSEEEIRRVLENGGYPACPVGAPGTNPLLNALKSPFTRKKDRIFEIYIPPPGLWGDFLRVKLQT